MSLAIPDASGLIKTVKVTAAAAVAVARAVDETVFCGQERALIKWVNDIYIDEKKVCGPAGYTGKGRISDKCGRKC